MSDTDGAQHQRLRDLTSKAFTPRQVERLRPRVTATADRLLDQMRQLDICAVDLKAGYALPLPLTVISELFGIPERHLDRLEVFGDLVPVLSGGVLERVPQQVDDAGLHDRLRPDALDRVGQALEPVADQHAHVADAAVLDLGQHAQPVLGALPVAVLAGPQARGCRARRRR